MYHGFHTACSVDIFELFVFYNAKMVIPLCSLEIDDTAVLMNPNLASVLFIVDTNRFNRQNKRP